MICHIVHVLPFVDDSIAAPGGRGQRPKAALTNDKLSGNNSKHLVFQGILDGAVPAGGSVGCSLWRVSERVSLPFPVSGHPALSAPRPVPPSEASGVCLRRPFHGHGSCGPRPTSTRRALQSAWAHGCCRGSSPLKGRPIAARLHLGT